MNLWSGGYVQGELSTLFTCFKTMTNVTRVKCSRMSLYLFIELKKEMYSCVCVLIYIVTEHCSVEHPLGGNEMTEKAVEQSGVPVNASATFAAVFLHR